VNTTTKLTVNLAPSGGVAIRFKALNEPQPSDD
jgi:hypothetical protein